MNMPAMPREDTKYPLDAAPSPMAVQMTRLNHVLSSVGNAFEDLAARIEPVLSPGQPFPLSDGLAAAREMRSPLVENISDAADCVERLIEQLSRLVNRVEI